jgi:hydrogenase maturation protease
VAAREFPSVAPKLLIFGYGNPSRGDDALGPLLLERLEEASLRENRKTPAVIELLTDFQLQIEHAMDLVNRDLVLFVDAHLACAPPYSLRAVGETAASSHTTHALSPGAVLKVYRQIEGVAPPPSFLLSIRGECFELGETLTAAASAHLNAALELVLSLCAQPTLGFWRSRCAPETAEPAK